MKKQGFIEGLRGIAAMQVVLLHYVSAILPVAGRVSGSLHGNWERQFSHSPLFFLIDGYSAVYLFFLMSGFVLMPSFLQPEPIVALQAAKRFIRLFLPTAAAYMATMLLLASTPTLRSEEVVATGSQWLEGLALNPMTFAALMRDGLLGSMLLGYRGISLFDDIALIRDHLPLISTALNAPLWTLHIEFWGSLMLIALAQLFIRLPHIIAFGLCLILLAVLGTSQMTLFVIGALLSFIYPTFQAKRGPRAAIIGAGLILTGLLTCVAKDWAFWSDLGRWINSSMASRWKFLWLASDSIWMTPDDFHWQSEIGATLIFIGVLMNSCLSRILSTPFLLWLGRLSFSLYLLHLPILFSIGFLVFLALLPAGYMTAFYLTIVGGLLISFGGAVLFQRYVDARAVLISKRVAMPHHFATVAAETKRRKI